MAWFNLIIDKRSLFPNPETTILPIMLQWKLCYSSRDSIAFISFEIWIKFTHELQLKNFQSDDFNLTTIWSFGSVAATLSPENNDHKFWNAALLFALVKCSINLWCIVFYFNLHTYIICIQVCEYVCEALFTITQ